MNWEILFNNLPQSGRLRNPDRVLNPVGVEKNIRILPNNLLRNSHFAHQEGGVEILGDALF